MIDDDLGTAPSEISLPPIPDDQSGSPVACWVEPLVIDTYLPDEPGDLPEFFEQRVYQGSSGRVYPLPFHERISQVKVPHAWNAIHLENEWLRVAILPELGGRIHIGYDKIADYDFIYRNNVIKPALVGLAGPWISGGIEFNWPQHHRPATFLPVDYEIEREPDGSVTVWCSDHDPFARMKGMHGVRLSPGRSVLELRVRLYNRTEETQTFLWWANVAAPVNDQYSSFFPIDVHEVADHARRAVTSFPRADGLYYGVDYPAQVSLDRSDADRLDWYRNIPVPTSYMILDTDYDFFGGYDHGRRAGFVHWADRRFVPGKKQWTWGNAPFGWAWDRNLTDTDGPYIELMAGAFTNNQPDFSFLMPGETKTFSQSWYPVHDTGVIHQATADCAMHLAIEHPEPGVTLMSATIAVTTVFDLVEVIVRVSNGEVVLRASAPMSPAAPYLVTGNVSGDLEVDDVTVEVKAGDRELARWEAPARSESGSQLDPATEPPKPEQVAGVDELFLIGQYLQQYRHATRMPDPYWLEAVRRDPGDVRSNTALAGRAAWAGDLRGAERYLRAAIQRQTSRVPNPSDGEPLYLLGIVLVRQGRDDEARDHLSKAMWNGAWRVPAGLALARLEARTGHPQLAIDRARQVTRLDADNLQARNLLVALLFDQGAPEQARVLLDETRRLDPLDQWARHLAGVSTTADAGTLLDVALEYASCGLLQTALEVLGEASSVTASAALGQVGVAPLIHFHRAELLEGLGRPDEAGEARADAAGSDDRHCLASRPEDVHALLAAVTAEPGCGLAHVLLGNWYYDKRRYGEAITHWSRSLECSDLPDHLRAMSHRNLGIAAFNVSNEGGAARDHYCAARSLRPADAKLLYEADQLSQRLGDSVESRIQELEANRRIVESRDDLTIVFATLLAEHGRAGDARVLLLDRIYQPWEGGEGMVLGAWDRTNLALARAARANRDPRAALDFVNSALEPPQSLGEARHPLANAAELYLERGDARAALGDRVGAEADWERAASFSGDFRGMKPQPFSEATYHSIVALQRLGRSDEALALAVALADWNDRREHAPAEVDFFATSLPRMLLFHTDPEADQATEVATIRAQLSGTPGLGR